MTLLNYIIYITFCILPQLLVEVKSQTTIFNPDLREGHTATFINDKLYILGGAIPPYANSRTPPKQTFLYLDCSTSFNTGELEWIDLSNTSNVVSPHYFAAAVKGGANNNTLFLYGGESLGAEPMSLVNTFNTLNNKWSVPILAGSSSGSVLGINPIVDYNGLMYLYGGLTSIFDGTYASDMFILDTTNLSLKKANSVNAPSPRVSYGAVLLPDKDIIVYMGGYNKNIGVFTLDTVYLYDTINNIWTTQETGGLIPSARSGFSSVLGLDGQRVIIFGESLYVLDLNNFNWYVPKIIGPIPSNRHLHRTVLIGKYMVVTFGEGYVQGTEDDVLLLDISNNDEYIWTTNFVRQPASPSSVTSPVTVAVQPNAQSGSNTGVIVSAVISSVFGGILLTIGSFLFYKRYKNNRKQNKAIPTPGNR